jgi:hypothetical protein
MAAAVVPLRHPPGDLPDLLARREQLQQEAGRLARVDQVRAEAEARMVEVGRASQELDQSEQQAWIQWSATADGASPPARVADRERIDRERSKAAAELAAAVNGQQAVAPRRAALTVELGQIGLALFKITVASLIAEGEAISAELHEKAGEFVAAAEREQALAQALHDALAAAIRTGNAGREEALRDGLKRLEQMKRPEMIGNTGRLAALTAEFARRLA